MSRGSKIVNIDLRELEILSGFGLTDKQLCIFYDISTPTFEKYKKSNELLLKALQRGKIIANNKVVKALFESAVGFYYNELTTERVKTGKKITKHKVGTYKSGKPKYKVIEIPIYEMVVTKRVKKFALPNISAIGLWLFNRNSDVWKSINKSDSLSNFIPELPEPFGTMSVEELEKTISAYQKKYDSLCNKLKTGEVEKV
jgi:hypothetical protein